MKNRVLSMAFLAALAVAAGFNYLQSENEPKLSELTMANIEALATREGGGSCSDSCKEWKGNSGGGIACDCGRYTGTCKNRC